MTTFRARAAGLILVSTLLAGCFGGDATPVPTQAPSTTAPSSPGGSPTSSEPSPTASPDQATPSAAPTAVPTPTAGEVTTYTVQRGDWLSAIARRFGTTVAQLQAWNADRYPSLVDDPNALQTGWVLVVAGEPGVTPLPAPTAAPATPRPTPPSTAGCRAGNRVAAGTP